MKLHFHSTSGVHAIPPETLVVYRMLLEKVHATHCNGYVRAGDRYAEKAKGGMGPGYIYF